MKILLKQLKLAKRYATALFKLGVENEKGLEEISSSFDLASEVFASSNDLEQFLLSKSVKKEDKKGILKAVFKGDALGATVLNLFCLLVDEDKFDHLNAIKNEFSKMVNAQNNVLEAQITSAIDLEDDDKDKIVAKLEKKLSKKIRANYLVDEKIIAGLVIKIEDNVIDNSHRTKLDNLKKHLI